MRDESSLGVSELAEATVAAFLDTFDVIVCGTEVLPLTGRLRRGRGPTNEPYTAPRRLFMTNVGETSGHLLLRKIGIVFDLIATAVIVAWWLMAVTGHADGDPRVLTLGVLICLVLTVIAWIRLRAAKRRVRPKVTWRWGMSEYEDASAEFRRAIDAFNQMGETQAGPVYERLNLTRAGAMRALRFARRGGR